MRRFRIAGVVALAIAFVSMFAVPASAHSGPIYYGANYAWTFYVNDDNVGVCDKERDPYSVYVEYRINIDQASDPTRRIYDGNGSVAPCYAADYTQTPYWVSAYRVCESGSGCSGWRYTDGIGGSSAKAGKHPVHIAPTIIAI